MKESNISKLIQIRASNWASRLFRINVGTGWTGDKIIKKGRDMVIKNYRPLSTGVPKGYHDLSGWTSIVITQEMVGSTVAVFTSAEVKTSTGRPTKEQINFKNAVIGAGGISGIVRSEGDLDQLLQAGPNSSLS